MVFASFDRSLSVLEPEVLQQETAGLALGNTQVKTEVKTQVKTQADPQAKTQIPYKLLHETWNWPKRWWWTGRAHSTLLAILPMVLSGLVLLWLWSLSQRISQGLSQALFWRRSKGSRNPRNPSPNAPVIPPLKEPQ